MEKDKSANLERQEKKKLVVQKSKFMWMNPFSTAPHLERELAIKEQLAGSMTQLLACSGKSILLVAGLPMQIHATLTNHSIHISWRRGKKKVHRRRKGGCQGAWCCREGELAAGRPIFWCLCYTSNCTNSSLASLRWSLATWAVLPANPVRLQSCG